MVEHLIWVTKATAGRIGEPEEVPTKSHLYFKKFIANGAIFQYQPKEDVTKNDLKPLKYASLEEAIANVDPAIDRFYAYFEDADVLSYNPMMGELSKEELEIFHAQHFRWHLYQFGLIADFA